MKAIGFKQSLPIKEANSFIAFETEKPTPTGFDLLVKISAISVNPVDFKIRESAAKDVILDTPKIIGWDAVGVVEAVGEKTSKFKVGDEVYYAGDITRSGSNAEFQLIDERIVGFKPKSLTIAESAAMPLTGLTAWESLFLKAQSWSVSSKNPSRFGRKSISYYNIAQWPRPHRMEPYTCFCFSVI